MNAATFRFGICVAGLVVVAGMHVTVVRADEAADFSKLEREVQRIETTLADPVAGKKEYAAAATALRSLRDQTNALIEATGDADGETPLHKLHVRIIAGEQNVAARLPIARVDRFVRTGFPVPEYEEEKLLGSLSAELQAAQAALASQLSETPDDREGAQKRLHALVLAQEKLAWEAGWPYRADEVERYKNAEQLTADIYLARRKRGIDSINRRLAADADANGRDRPRRFVIHAPQDEAHVAEITKALAESRGAAAESWRKGTKPFDKKERQALLGAR